MYVERETATNTPGLEMINEPVYELSGSVYDDKNIAESESRALRIVKERIIAELRTVKPDARSSTLSIGEPCPSATNGDKALSIPLQGKGSSRCKSTTSQDSGYYSEPRVHTPKSSNDRCIGSRKEKSKPPLSGAVLRFVTASHPDELKDARTMKQIRKHAMRSFLRTTDSAAPGDSAIEKRATPESHYALPDLGNLISGWEANIHAEYGEKLESLHIMDLDDASILAKSSIGMEENARAARRRHRSRREKTTQVLEDWQNVLEASNSVLESRNYTCRGRPGPAAPIDKQITQQEPTTSGEAISDTVDETIETTQNSEHLKTAEENYALLKITSDKRERIGTNMAQQSLSIARFLMPTPESFLSTSFNAHQPGQLCQSKTKSSFNENIMDSVEDQTDLNRIDRKRLERGSGERQKYTEIPGMANKDVDPNPQIAKNNNRQQEILVHAVRKGKNAKEDWDHESDGKDQSEVTGRSHTACFSADDEIEETSASSALSDEPEDPDGAPDGDLNDNPALESALSAIKSVLLKNLLDCTQLEAVDATGDSPSSSRSSIAGNGSNMSIPQSSKGSSNNNTTKRPRGAGRNDPGDDDDDSSSEDDDDSRRPQKKHLLDRTPQRRLRCPFYQREPDKHTKAACRGEGFTEMGKLKDHLKRVHTQPLRCPRCHIEVESIEERDEHLSQDIICAKRPRPYDERIQLQVLKKLDFKKAPFANARNTEEKWRMMYKILFSVKSEAEIPSPYDRNVLSPGLANALSEALEEELAMELAPLLSPIMARIKNRIPAIIQNCRTKLAYQASLANDEMASVASLAQSSASSSISSEPVRLRKKKKLSSLSQCVDHASGAMPTFTATANETDVAQTPCLSVHRTTPSGSSTASGQKSQTPPSSTTDQVYDVEAMNASQYSAIDNWNAYKTTLFSYPYSGDSMLSNPGIPSLADGFGPQDSAIRPFYNDPHIYGGSSSLGTNFLDAPILQTDLGAEGCYQPQEFRSGNLEGSFPPYPL